MDVLPTIGGARDIPAAPVRGEVLLLWPLIKVWHHMNIVVMAVHEQTVLWGGGTSWFWAVEWPGPQPVGRRDPLMLQGPITPGPGDPAVYLSYSRVTWGYGIISPSKCVSNTSLPSVSGGICWRFWHGSEVAPPQWTIVTWRLFLLLFQSRIAFSCQLLKHTMDEDSFSTLI